MNNPHVPHLIESHCQVLFIFAYGKRNKLCAVNSEFLLVQTPCFGNPCDQCSKTCLEIMNFGKVKARQKYVYTICFILIFENDFHDPYGIPLVHNVESNHIDPVLMPLTLVNPQVASKYDNRL